LKEGENVIAEGLRRRTQKKKKKKGGKFLIFLQKKGEAPGAPEREKANVPDPWWGKEFLGEGCRKKKNFLGEGKRGKTGAVTWGKCGTI